jgi:hypothetical protein
MPLPDWRSEYGRLLDLVAAAVDGVPDLDLTAELITHRFTPGSKEVLMGWYPRTQLDMDESTRTQKRGKFGGIKHVYPKDVMSELRGWFEPSLAERLRLPRPVLDVAVGSGLGLQDLLGERVPLPAGHQPGLQQVQRLGPRGGPLQRGHRRPRTKPRSSSTSSCGRSGA